MIDKNPAGCEASFDDKEATAEMCGIAGLFLKDRNLESALGALLAGMLSTLSDRGPDSAGFALYGAETPGSIKLTLRGSEGFDFDPVLKSIRAAVGGNILNRQHETHLVISVPQDREVLARQALSTFTGVSIVGYGRRMEIFKEVGRPEDVSRRFGLHAMQGSHGIGHTRMATESAVTTKGAHPFTTGPDQCLVHNGSLSNHNSVRRELIKQGLVFQTENDTEVAAGFVTSKLRDGLSLKDALEASLRALDGFYTFVIGTESGFGVLRDPIACKPAVMAETDRWVAFGSEYRALVDLPGIDSARVWEPTPAKVYRWELN
jgi:glutamate synthase domain-containing protein 1